MSIRISPSVRMKALIAGGFRCIYCGATPSEAKLEVDHVIPVSHGGTNDPGNLAVACRECNIGKAGRSILPVVDSDIGVYVQERPRRDGFGEVPPKALRDEFYNEPVTPWVPVLAERWRHIVVDHPAIVMDTKYKEVSFRPTVTCRGRENSDIGDRVHFLIVPWRKLGDFTPYEKEQITNAVICGSLGAAYRTAVIMGTPSLFFGVVFGVAGTRATNEGQPVGQCISHFIEPMGVWFNKRWKPFVDFSFKDLREPYRKNHAALRVMDFDMAAQEIVGVYASIDGMGVWNGL